MIELCVVCKHFVMNRVCVFFMRYLSGIVYKMNSTGPRAEP